MSRQVDVKALISHIVRGDGADKCRICMGDTTEGQVYLGDTVMMDGDKPVSLSELLETITGVEVQLDGVRPSGLCTDCLHSALNAAAFRKNCCTATEKWQNAVELLETLPELDIADKHSIHAVMEENQIMIIFDQNKIKQETEISDSEASEAEADTNQVVRKTKPTKSLERVCSCPHCGKTFSYALSLYEHLMDSADDKRLCYICTKALTRDTLANHLKTAHKKEIFSCTKCAALLPTLKQLQRHISKVHAPGAYSCTDCGHSFTSIPALNGHIILHLAKDCPNCGKLFRNRRCYTHHVKICCNLNKNRDDKHNTKHKVLYDVELSNNKKIKVGPRGSANKECICDYCGKTFAGKKFVCAHIQIVHMKNTHKACPYCGKSYAAAHMTEHIKKHQGTLSFTCDHCGMTLKSRLGYIQHLRLHTGEKPYKCKYCSETFSASSRRSEHIRKSHRRPEDIVLKHVCEFCPARFRLPYKLKQHIATVHEGNDQNTRRHKCSTCQVSFGSVRGLLYHSRTHQTVDLKSIMRDEAAKSENTAKTKHFTCIQCKVTFSSIEDLTSHSKTHEILLKDNQSKETKVRTAHSRVYKCPTCQLDFGTYRRLLIHSKTHEAVSLNSKLASEENKKFNLNKVDQNAIKTEIEVSVERFTVQN